MVVGDLDAENDLAGRVYFYRMNIDSGKFDLIQTITSPSPNTSGDNFGFILQLYGNYLVVGDHDASDPDEDGAVYFYKMDR